MNQGAFAFLDCLGFKGVWNRGVDPGTILAFLRESKHHGERSPVMTVLQEVAKNVQQSIVFVSDTVAISTRLRTPPAKESDLVNGYLIHMTVLLASELSRRVVSGPTPLMFRGCVTFGNHLAEESFLLGPAVDEAASVAQATEGAFVWLTPAAQALWRAYDAYERKNGVGAMRKMDSEAAVSRVALILELNKKFKDQAAMPEEIERNSAYWQRLTPEQKRAAAVEIMCGVVQTRRDDFLIQDYPMEMKGGGHLQADVINPLTQIPPQNHVEWINLALSGFGNAPLGVLLKKQNTLRFLEQANRRTTEVHEHLVRKLRELREKIASITRVPFEKI